MSRGVTTGEILLEEISGKLTELLEILRPSETSPVGDAAPQPEPAAEPKTAPRGGGKTSTRRNTTQPRR